MHSWLLEDTTFARRCNTEKSKCWFVTVTHEIANVICHGPFATGITVVGHVPRRISAICYGFLGKPGTSIYKIVALELKFASSSTPCKFRKK